MLYQIEKYNIPRFLKLDKLLKRKDLIVGNIEQYANANIRCISIPATNERYFVNLKVFFSLMIRKEIILLYTGGGKTCCLLLDRKNSSSLSLEQRILQICAYLF